MTGDGRPLLALGAPEVGDRYRQPPSVPPSVQGPGSRRQGERLTPQFRELGRVSYMRSQVKIAAIMTPAR